jgi:hypothetical protein
VITVLGPIFRGDGSVFIGRMKLKPLWSPASIAGEPVINAVMTVNCADPDGGFVVVGSGEDELTLNAGTWLVTFPSAPEVDPIYLAVPGGNSQIAFADLMAAGASAADVLNPLIGEGSPEGVVIAGGGRTYWDKLNKEFWIKDTEEVGNVGWRALIA